MRVVVTGAAGRLGRKVVETLQNAGHQTSGVDISPSPAPGHVVADILDPTVAPSLLQGADALVHTAGRLGCHGEDGEQTYVENLNMAYRTFSAAAHAGVKKVILASSIQVIGWGADPSKSIWGFTPEYLPLDDRYPRRPGSLYALNKCALEDLLEFYTRTGAFDAVSLRLPRLMEESDFTAWQEKMLREESAWIVMSYRSAARLTAACLETSLPGYRAYLVADEDAGLPGGHGAFLQKHYPHLPSAPEAFVDSSRATRETGWQPARWPQEDLSPQ